MKTVGIAQLKARLSEHLKLVRRGRTLTVLDRDTPVAQIVPYAGDALEIRRATRAVRELPLVPRPSKPTDSLAVLLDDRPAPMNAYVDTSALLRLVLREAGGLDELRSVDRLVSSELIAVESARTIDRLRLQGSLSAEEAPARLKAVNDWIEAIDLVLLRPIVLNRAAGPLPTPIGTLDAIHLATALVWRERIAEPLVIATHDAGLALAARSFAFDVLGA